jgi:uncharacterized protein (TIGR02996 family)
MSDENALLGAIAAHPEEDTPRLMYADWLDEHGRPVRAEFIRVQIEIARKEHLPRAMLNRYVDLFKRNQELIDNHGNELLGPLAVLPTNARIEFRRGFPSEVTVEALTFWHYARLLADLCPRPRVVVANEVVGVVDLLGFSSQGNPELWEVVGSIRTIPDRSPTPAHPFWRLRDDFQPHRWPNLHDLDVSGCRLGDAHSGTLLRAALLPAVSDLDASGNELTDAAVDSLLDSGLPGQLKRLIFGGNDITDTGAQALAERWPTGADDRLENLNLRFSHIGQAGQRALLERFGGRVDLF